MLRVSTPVTVIGTIWLTGAKPRFFFTFFLSPSCVVLAGDTMNADPFSAVADRVSTLNPVSMTLALTIVIGINSNTHSQIYLKESEFSINKLALDFKLLILF
jgi:hypothetical protein